MIGHTPYRMEKAKIRQSGPAGYVPSRGADDELDLASREKKWLCPNHESLSLLSHEAVSQYVSFPKCRRQYWVFQRYTTCAAMSSTIELESWHAEMRFLILYHAKKATIYENRYSDRHHPHRTNHRNADAGILR